MNLVSTGLQLTDLTTKWGLVSLVNSDGSIARQYAINGADADRIVRGNNIVPPGCTEDEYRDFNVVVGCRPCNPGQCLLQPDSSLIVNFGVVIEAGAVKVNLMSIPAEQFSIVDGVVSVPMDIKDQIDVPFSPVIESGPAL